MNKGVVAIGAYCVFILAVGSMHSRFHLNFSESAPSGLWLDQPDVSIERSSWVSVCPPVSLLTKAMADAGALSLGECPTLNSAPLLKPIGAVPGDVVRLYKGRSVTVNGITLPNTIATHSFAWPDGEYIVKPDEVWLFSTYSAKSFDSRYFGPVKIEQIQGNVIPIIISGDHDA